MVYHGPSKGCQACRKRRVKCDQQRPSCGACIKRNEQHICIYRVVSLKPQRDEAPSSVTRLKPQPTTELVRSAGRSNHSSLQLAKYNSLDAHTQILIVPPADREFEAICFFFANYVNIPYERQSNVMAECVIPAYNQASANSHLKLATTATAVQLSELWRQKGPDSELAHNVYLKAVSALRKTFLDPNFAENTDLILATIFMLDFYDSLGRRFKQCPNTDMHLKAAMALVEQQHHLGTLTDTATRVFTTLRSHYIHFSLQNRRRVGLSPELLAISNNTGTPMARLDLIVAQLANLIYDSRNLVSVGSDPFPLSSSHHDYMPDSDMTYEVLLWRIFDISAALDDWQDRLGLSWQPCRNTEPESIHHSIRAVGLYNGLCDVYTSQYVSNVYNGWRCQKVLVLRLIKHCLQFLPPSQAYPGSLGPAKVDYQIQALVDDICASVPFLLGSRTSVTLPHNHHVKYPPVPSALRESADYVDSSGMPTTMTDEDHSRAAAATGGWFLLTSMAVVLRYCQPIPTDQRPIAKQLLPLKLRHGQMEWILAQVKRIHKVYHIPFKGEQLGNANATDTTRRHDDADIYVPLVC
ncbi:hypothetical protein DV736_g4677, partial [Chaetothyriales sp. CBS 134916]